MRPGLVISDPRILGGTPVLAGTRFPIRMLFESFAEGMSIDDILDLYPELTRDQIVEALREADRQMERRAFARSAG
jgi:uncharacterized protein (DUF433 family)